jgi:anthranilate synthase/aminodeoxychorismate synthase-like glutamine amidotransferase
VIVVVDNYDSFTFNLVQFLGELGEEIRVFRNDRITVDEIERLAPARIVISPGPGVPRNAGISEDVVRRFHGRVPILGVCLGHQAIGEVFGGRVVPAPSLMHGKVSRISHDGRSVFTGLPQEFVATRYHSLVVADVPDSLEVTATSDDGVIMGLRHRAGPTEGIQFHPESIMTGVGMDLLRNFLLIRGDSVA